MIVPIFSDPLPPSREISALRALEDKTKRACSASFLRKARRGVGFSNGARR